VEEGKGRKLKGRKKVKWRKERGGSWRKEGSEVEEVKWRKGKAKGAGGKEGSDVEEVKWKKGKGAEEKKVGKRRNEG
jgi:hypothetical protein